METNDNGNKKLILAMAIATAVGLAIMAVIIVLFVVKTSSKKDNSADKRIERESKSEKKKKAVTVKTDEGSEEDTENEEIEEAEAAEELEMPLEQPSIRQMLGDYRDPYECIAGDYDLSSGAGGWASAITVNEDGTFEASSYDRDMGDIGPGYPNGTLYVAKCSGRLELLESVDEYTYRFVVVEKEDEYTSGEEIIDEERDIYFIMSEFDVDKVVELYLPGKLVSGMHEDAYRWLTMVDEEAFETTFLTQYALNCVDENNLYRGKRANLNYEFPEAAPVKSAFELNGLYDGDDGTLMLIDIDNVGLGDGKGCGFIRYDETLLPKNVSRKDAVIEMIDESHFVGKPYWISDWDGQPGYAWRTYNLYVSKNDKGKTTLTVYNDDNFVYAVFTKRD